MSIMESSIDSGQHPSKGPPTGLGRLRQANKTIFYEVSMVNYNLFSISLATHHPPHRYYSIQLLQSLATYSRIGKNCTAPNAAIRQTTPAPIGA